MQRSRPLRIPDDRANASGPRDLSTGTNGPTAIKARNAINELFVFGCLRIDAWSTVADRNTGVKLRVLLPGNQFKGCVGHESVHVQIEKSGLGERLDPTAEISPHRYPSFPSGHTTRTLAGAAVVWIAYPRWRWACALASASVAVGLLVMDYHFVSDEIAALLLAASSGCTRPTSADFGSNSIERRYRVRVIFDGMTPEISNVARNRTKKDASLCGGESL